MPELPEVESLRRLLLHRLVSARVVDACFIFPAILRGIDPTDFISAVIGKTCVDVARRGKYLLLSLAERPAARAENDVRQESASAQEQASSDLTLVVHLRMRGSLRIEPHETAPGKYLCAALLLDDGRDLRFYDMWRWGEWWLIRDGKEAEIEEARTDAAGTEEVRKEVKRQKAGPHADKTAIIPGLKLMGLEPFDSEFTVAYLRKECKRRRGPIKPILLGQRVVAGLGNIYCDESLHRARLHPARKADSLREEEVERLHQAICEVLEQAVTQGGAYVDDLAAHNANLHAFEGIYTPRIYDRPGSPCPTCGQSLQKISFYGRGTTFCPQCQPDAEPA